MRDKMRIGDMVLYYHSNTKPPHIAGIARICKESYPDITQFDRKSKYYDPKATEETPRWFLVDMEPVSKFEEMVTLDQLKDNSALGSPIRCDSRVNIRNFSWEFSGFGKFEVKTPAPNVLMKPCM